MPVPCPSRSLALVSCALGAVLACAPSAEVRSCASADGCPAGSRCVSATCVANAPPAVVVALPASPEANALLSFDASASTDADPGDAVVSFGWKFRALSGEPCAPPVVAGTGPLASVRFGCAGRYAVDVTGTDRMGATSTATKELDVADGPALVVVGADIPVDHVCTPAAGCTPSGPVALSASAPAVQGPVAFAWTVEPPPDRPLGPHRSVTFSPSAAVASPVVGIATDGEAISGDWVFRVEATDASGVVGTAAMRVSVGNRLPVVTKTIPSADHAFDGSQFTAAGEVPFAVSDPDGDTLLDPVVEWRHSGDGGSTFTGLVLGAPGRVTFSIAVPYAAPTDAGYLIGGPGLERAIGFAISDVNGGTTSERWPIVVANRRPVLVSEPAPFTVNHRFDALGLAYLADVPLSTWSDPDGDPLAFTTGMTTGDPDCADVVVEAGLAVAHCRLPFTGTPIVGNFAGSHTVGQSVQDPWTEADATSHVTFSIGNQPPTITSTATFVETQCTYTDTCCRSPEGFCDTYSATVAAIAHVPSRWADPDGDPVFVEVAAVESYAPVQPLLCVPGSCTLDVSIGPMPVCMISPVTSLPTTVTDGLASTTGSLPMQALCP